MSSDPNTPDFDSMSPEEMMAWMESLAKRQGADEGFTTAADVEIEEVDPDTVDESILNQKYIPDGWTEEKWDAHLAKEEAEKEARRAARDQEAAPPQPTPQAEAEPEPEPEPEAEPAVAQADSTASADELDYDNMSPEELMEWMESLAKRKGATEGFTTAASMDVAEVDPSTVDESILNQKYVPDGWTEEKWDAYLEEEERKKQAKQQAEPLSEPELVDEDEEEELVLDLDELELIDDEDEQLATMNLDDLPTLDLTEEETEAAADSPMAWLENLAATDEDSEEIDIPDLSALGEDMGGLSELAQEEEAGDPMDWLASLAADVDDGAPDLDLDDMSAGLEGLEAFALSDEDEDEDEDEELVDLSEVGDPVSFLDNLARMEGAPEDELSTDVDQAFLDDLVADGEMDVSDALDDTQPSEELSFLTETDDALEAALPWDEQDPSSIENPEEWLDALAQSTSGDAQLPMFDDDEEEIDLLPEMEDSYEEDVDLSLEMEEDAGEVEPLPALEEDVDHDSKVLEALNSGADVAPEDIEAFFANQFKKAEQFADRDEDFSQPEEESEVEAAVAPSVPDWLQELSTAPEEAVAEDADADVDEDDGEDLMADVLAGLEAEDEEPELEDILALDTEDEAEQVGIPDWLSDSAPEDEAESVDMGWLSDDAPEAEDEAEQVGIPDWLSEDAEADTGDVIADIIADELDVEPGETTIIETDAGQIEVDPNDTWTQAFLMENREEDAEAWYNRRLSEIGDGEVVAQTEPEPELEDTTLEMTSPPGAISLEPTTLPIEEELAEGQPELAPEWLTGVASQEEELPVPDFEMMAEDDAADEMPSWLEDSISDEDEIELPDWLNEEDEDEAAIPDWLSDASGADVEPAAIPDWLTDTMEEPEEVILSPVPQAEPEPEPAAMIVTPPPAPDVSGAIQAAQQKVSAGNVDEALVEYESVVRANDRLDVVISDLQKLTKDDKHKKNPAVYRCLGDALMRNGDLQDALDIYRRALNLL